jgi:hypothetical protein
MRNGRKTGKSAYFQIWGDGNVNLRHVSASWPVMAQTGGKSFAAIWDAQTRTQSWRGVLING